MPRSKSSVTRKARVKKILKQAKGYFGKRKNLFSVANQSVLRSGMYSFAHRRKKKRDFIRLWNMRINAAVREHGLSYSKFMNQLKKTGIALNRKSLSNLAIEDREAFKVIVDLIKPNG